MVTVKGQLQGINHSLLTRQVGIEPEDIVNSALFGGHIANSRARPLPLPSAGRVLEVVYIVKMAFDILMPIGPEANRRNLLHTALTDPFPLVRGNCLLDIEAKSPDP